MLCDAPQYQTGFARVASNLGKRWHPFFDAIDVWAIGHSGYPHELEWVRGMYPGGPGETWNSAEKLQQFLNLMMQRERKYTHVWMLQDHFMLSHSDFPTAVRDACNHIGMKSFMYVPVDAAVERHWMDIVNSVNRAVAYTEYGRDQIIQALDGTSVMGPKPYPIATMPVIPHGTDPSIYRPMDGTEEIRRRVFRDWAKPEDFVMICVSVNQRRKAHQHVMQVAAELKKLNLPRKVKLVMHMATANDLELFDLRPVGRQLGLTEGIDYITSDDYFKRGHAILTENNLAELYNASDLLVSGTLGEGWGLSITEAMLCGLDVAVPAHTAIWEILDNARRMGVSQDKMAKLPLSTTCVVNMMDNSRVRYPIDPIQSAALIAERVKAAPERLGEREKVAPPAEFLDWLNWNRISKQWLKVFGISDDEIRDRYQDL